MLILRMLLRITNFTQSELASFLGISRASLNFWLSNDSTMSNTSKINIANRFQFPVSYFDVDLDQDITLYRVIFSSLCNSWNRIKYYAESNGRDDKIDTILNELESTIFDDSVKNVFLTEEEIIAGLADGYNPYTGECFEENHILQMEDVKRILLKVKNSYGELKRIITKEDLNKEQLDLFEKLRMWRREKALEEEHDKPYLVFSDKDLLNIVSARLNKKTDLLKVKGIGQRKYEKYSKELWDIIKTDPFADFDFEITLDDGDLPF